jgi:hypothetical protein
MTVKHLLEQKDRNLWTIDPDATVLGHFAIDSGRLYVVTAAVGGDREGFEGEVFSVTLARESVRAAKFLIAGEPAEYRGSGRHRGIGTNDPEAFTVFPIAALAQQRGFWFWSRCASGRP